MKFTFEQKLRAVKQYIEKGFCEVPKGIGSKAETYKRHVLEWASLYRQCGEDALRHGHSREFSKEDKFSAVKRVLSGETASAVGRSLGMANPSNIIQWVKAYRKSGMNGLESKSKGRKPRNAKEEENESAKPRTAREREAERRELLAAARECLLKKIESLGGGGEATPRLKAEVVDEVRKDFPEATLSDLLLVAKLSKSTYFYQKNWKDWDLKNKELAEQIAAICEENRYRYGRRKVTAVLKDKGFRVEHGKVDRLMTQMGLSGTVKRVHYNSYTGGPGNESPDRIIMEYTNKLGAVHHKSDFSCSRPDEKWTTDVSQFNVCGTKLYLAPIKDMYTGEIISYDLSLSPNLDQQKRMLAKAFATHGDLRGTIFHSDQGWQYRHPEYMALLKEKGMLQSMSRKGNCLDNCIMESFFGTMKNEMFYGHEKEFGTVDEFRKAVDEYIAYYNSKRLHYYKDLKKYMAPLQRRSLSAIQA